MNKRLISKKSGMALALVLIVSAVLIIMGSTLLSISSAETQNSFRDAKKLKAHYIAQAGVDTVVKDILKTSNNTSTYVNSLISGGAITGSVGDGNFNTVVSKPSTSVLIKSTCTLNGIPPETCSLNMDSIIITGSSFSNVIYSGDPTTPLVVNSNTSGPLQSASTISGYDPAKCSPVQPNLQMTLPPVQVPTLTSRSLPAVVSGNRTITQSGSYPDITVNNVDTTFNVPAGNTLEVAINTFTTKGNVFVTGGGKLRLFITNIISLQTPNDINPPATPVTPSTLSNAVNGLTVFIASGGLAEFDLQANVKFYGAIYGPDATVKMQSAQSEIDGAIICKTFDSGNPNTTLKYVPIDSAIDFSSYVQTMYKKTLYSNN